MTGERGPRPRASPTYGDVDHSDDPADAAAWMDRVAGYRGIADSKERALALLAGCERVLDVGCGVGNDVRALGPGAIGVDPSRTMIGEAAGRGGVFAIAAGQALPFADATFDGVKADRVLQHVVDPDAVTAELVRVAAAGAPVVVTDPDQATVAIEGPDRGLTAVVEQYRRDGVRNGFLAGHMAEVLAAAGCADIGVDRFAEVVDEIPLAFGLATWSSFLVEDGLFTEEEAAAFDASLAAAGAEGRFAYRIDIVVTHGRRA